MQALYEIQGQRVMVVDDEPLLRGLCSSLLSSWGYEVTEAHDGQDALEKLRLASVDAVLVDINMPRLRGDALLACLRREQPALPVVIMSSDFMETTRTRVLDLGASSFLAKPFRPIQLKEHISQALL